MGRHGSVLMCKAAWVRMGTCVSALVLLPDSPIPRPIPSIMHGHPMFWPYIPAPAMRHRARTHIDIQTHRHTHTYTRIYIHTHPRPHAPTHTVVPVVGAPGPGRLPHSHPCLPPGRTPCCRGPPAAARHLRGQPVRGSCTVHSRVRGYIGRRPWRKAMVHARYTRDYGAISVVVHGGKRCS